MEREKVSCREMTVWEKIAERWSEGWDGSVLVPVSDVGLSGVEMRSYVDPSHQSWFLIIVSLRWFDDSHSPLMLAKEALHRALAKRGHESDASRVRMFCARSKHAILFVCVTPEYVERVMQESLPCPQSC